MSEAPVRGSRRRASMSTRPSIRPQTASASICPTKPTNFLKGRVQVINLWRPIRGPLRDAPLAMLDGKTVEPGDLIASDLIYPNRRGETYSVKYNPNHRWFYFPEMTAGRSGAAQVLRFRNRRPHPFRAAYRLHRSDHAGRRAAARKHRAADAGVPQAVTSFTSPRAGSSANTHCLWNTSVRNSMLSRGGASAGVVGSTKAVCGPKRVRPSVAES